MYGQRVAILDLRKPTGQFPIGPDAPFRCTGRIKHFPLVEGDYHDLASLTVSAATKEGELAPYAAPFGGLVELECVMKFLTFVGDDVRSPCCFPAMKVRDSSRRLL